MHAQSRIISKDLLCMMCVTCSDMQELISHLFLATPRMLREGISQDVRPSSLQLAISTSTSLLFFPVELRNFPSPQPRSLAVGTKAQRPPNVPSHLPAFPDPHTYVKTPVSEHALFKV